MTRSEYITWCQLRASNTLAKGNLQGALEGFITDMNGHQQTQINQHLTMMALKIIQDQDFDEAEKFIGRFS